jgi:hypothetical protein
LPPVVSAAETAGRTLPRELEANARGVGAIGMSLLAVVSVVTGIDA